MSRRTYFGHRRSRLPKSGVGQVEVDQRTGAKGEKRMLRMDFEARVVKRQLRALSEPLLDAKERLSPSWGTGTH